MRHKQPVELHRLSRLHRLVARPDDGIVRENGKDDGGDGGKGRLARVEVEIMRWRAGEEFVAFVKDGPELDAKRPLHRREGDLVHGAQQRK